MAATVLTNVKCLVNSVDLSDHVTKLTLSYSAEEKESTAMGSGTKTRLAGLLDWSLDIEFNQDWAASKVDATLFPLVGAAAFAVSIVPVNGTVTTTNPAYEGNAILTDYPPLGVAVGDLAGTSVKIAGSGTLTRRTS